MIRPLLVLLTVSSLFAQGTQEKPAASERPPEKSTSAQKRIELNLLGASDTDAGESRRNENVQFNLVDNNALKELNVRLGVTATIVDEFRADRSWFGAEFGNTPAAPPHVPRLSAPRAFHGAARWSHLNSIFSARTFFQVGDVQPARENDYGVSATVRLWRGANFSFDGGQQKIRGMVNGNVLVPRADERTPLTTDPADRAIVQRLLDAYPALAPNRTDINPRALNTNAPQRVNSDNATGRLDQQLGARDRVGLLYSFTGQRVDAFQLVKGQNPDTLTHSHRARLTWTRTWSAATVSELTAGFDRVGSLLVPDPEAVGAMVSTGGLTTLGPEAIIPIDRAQNLFRYAGVLRRTQGRHNWTAGFGLARRQLNGTETDAHRGFFSFGNDFGRDAITNLRLGAPSQHIVSIGNVHRGFRNWDTEFYAGDTWRASSATTVSASLRYTPVTRPYEVNGLNTVPYNCDCNNFAPSVGVAQRLGAKWGVLRAGGGVQYGEIYPVTFQQVRFSPPGSVKIVVMAPKLSDPLAGGINPDAKGNIYALDPELATPYSYQYNASWEPAFSSKWRLQLGYVGSRSHKLLLMWYQNRAQPVEGIPQTTATINQRRPDQRFADYRWVLNGSQGYFDAARVSFIMPNWRGLTLDTAYWFSKAMDLGSAYTNTAYDADSRKSRAAYEYETRGDMRARSDFDQPHALVWRATYQTPASRAQSLWRRALSGWNFSVVNLLKQGTPFTVNAGSDAPGFGNVDGNGGDRPNLLDASILGRTVGNPDQSRALLPRSAFSFMQPTDARGNLGRNTFRKGKIANVNASVMKEWRWNGTKRIAVRGESVNLFNTPQFADPGLDLANPNFAQITNTLNEGRTLRLQLQLGW